MRTEVYRTTVESRKEKNYNKTIKQYILLHLNVDKKINSKTHPEQRREIIMV